MMKSKNQKPKWLINVLIIYEKSILNSGSSEKDLSAGGHGWLPMVGLAILATPPIKNSKEYKFVSEQEKRRKNVDSKKIVKIIAQPLRFDFLLSKSPTENFKQYNNPTNAARKRGPNSLIQILLRSRKDAS